MEGNTIITQPFRGIETVRHTVLSSFQREESFFSNHKSTQRKKEEGFLQWTLTWVSMHSSTAREAYLLVSMEQPLHSPELRTHQDAGSSLVEPEIPLMNETAFRHIHVLNKLLATSRLGVWKSDLPPLGLATYIPSQQDGSNTTPLWVKTQRGSFFSSVAFAPTLGNHRESSLPHEAIQWKKIMMSTPINYEWFSHYFPGVSSTHVTHRYRHRNTYFLV